jgi:hypothetical protein
VEQIGQGKWCVCHRQLSVKGEKNGQQKNTLNEKKNVIVCTQQILKYSAK